MEGVDLWKTVVLVIEVGPQVVGSVGTEVRLVSSHVVVPHVCNVCLFSL